MYNGIGIGSWWGGSGNLIKGNYISNVGSAIELDSETDSIVKCNTANQNIFGISVNPGSTGNILQGNQVNDNIVGITLYGLGMPEDPDAIVPGPAGNLIRNNITLGNAWVDLSEVVYNEDTEDIFVHPDDTCRNAWMKNQFVTEMGPSNCIGLPVELDEDDVCALDADD